MGLMSDLGMIRNLGVSKNRGKTPQIIHFNRVFHYFHHPFWGTTIFGNTHFKGFVILKHSHLPRRTVEVQPSLAL